MKKTLFVLFAVLLASFLATCDLLNPPDTDDDLPGSTEDGMVRLSINVAGTSRALTTDLARANADYYEVVFQFGSRFYQAEWDHDTGHTEITIPVANYAPGAGNDAVLFAGKDNGSGDYTLLGIGAITSTTDENNSVYSGANIQHGTKAVTFTLTALTNDVNINNGHHLSRPSTFQILGPTSPINYSTVNASPNSIGTASGGSVSGCPVFSVPRSLTLPNADNPSARPPYNNDDYLVGQYMVKCGDKLAAVKLYENDYTVKTPTDSYDIFDNGDGLTGVVGVPIKPALNQALTVEGFVFYIDFSGASNAAGHCLISIDAPVYAFSLTRKTGRVLIWHIRGGTHNDKADGSISEQSAEGSLGGAVLLAVE
jgi:hypothetical protein